MSYESFRRLLQMVLVSLVVMFLFAVVMAVLK